MLRLGVATALVMLTGPAFAQDERFGFCGSYAELSALIMQMRQQGGARGSVETAILESLDRPEIPPEVKLALDVAYAMPDLSDPVEQKIQLNDYVASGYRQCLDMR